MQESLGPYQLQRLIGEGGMGQVYESLDRRSGERVAVKLLRGGAMSTERERELFAREARVGMELSHPGLVKVLDVDIHEGEQPYLVMEYLPGPSLKGVLAADGLAPASALAIVLPLLETLAYVHERGIVHRDIKTGNIMLDGDGRPRLMDFGLTTFSDETSLSRSGIVFGSPHYMSPEQGLGEALDARSDLFSLCVVLFELLTGRLPFRGSHPLAVVYAIVNEEPSPVSRLHSGLPEALDWVLARGLAKRQEDRYATAAALGADLRQIDTLLRRECLAAELTLEAAPGRGTAGAEHFPLPLAGRTGELERLRRFIQGEGSALLMLAGEAGVGKTRLVREAVSRAGLAPSQVLVGRTQPGGESFPYQPWLEAMRPALREREIGRREALAAYLGGEDGAARAALLHPFLTGDRGEGSPPENREQLFEALRSLLRALAAEPREAARLIWLEDLHRSDHASLDLLAFLTRGRPGELPPLLVSYRAEEIEADAPLATLQRVFHAENRATVLELGRLAEPAVLELVEAVLPALQSPAAAARRLHDESGGNPFVLRELLEILARRSAAALAKDPEQWELPLPERLQDLVKHRLAAVDEDERELLELASVEGEAFTAEVLAAVLEERKIRILRRLQGLERRTRLVQAREGRFLFDHALVRRALYEGLGDEIRREYHREVGEHLERSAAERAESAAAIARHFDGAEERRRAMPYHLRAGRHARALYAPAEARRHLERAREEADLWWLEEPEGEARLLRLETLRELGLLAQTEGRYDEAVDLFAGAASLLTPLIEESRRAELERLRGECFHHGGKPEDAARAFTAALAHCPPGERAEHARILRSRAYMQARGNDWDGALASCETALLLSERDAAACHAIRQTQGIIHLQRGQLDAARALFAEVVAEATSDAERYLRTAALANLGTVLWRQGEQAEALRCLEESLGIRKRLGLVIEYAQILVNLGIIRTWLGELDAARALFDEARELKNRIGDAPGLAAIENSLGNLAVRAGRLPESIPHFEEAAERHGAGGNRARAAVALHNLGEVYLDLGRLEEAEAPLAQSRAIREELGLGGARISSLRATAKLLAARGETEAARAAFDSALALAEESGARDEGLKAHVDRLRFLLDQDRAEEAETALADLRAGEERWPPLDLEFDLALLGARIDRVRGRPAKEELLALLAESPVEREPYRRLLVLAELLGLPDGSAEERETWRQALTRIREDRGFEWWRG